MPTKAERMAAMDEVAMVLVAAGFEPDGATREHTMRIPTVDQPVYGRTGGELATFGGRARYVLSGTNVKATVGRMTTSLYKVEGRGLDGVRAISNVDTFDVAAVRTLVEQVVAEVPKAPTP